MKRSLSESESSQFFLLNEAEEFLKQAVPHDPLLRRKTLNVLRGAWAVGCTTDGQALYSRKQLVELIYKVQRIDKKVRDCTQKRMKKERIPTVWDRLRMV